VGLSWARRLVHALRTETADRFIVSEFAGCRPYRAVFLFGAIALVAETARDESLAGLAWAKVSDLGSATSSSLR
jgi:hypothetical protein